MSSTSQKFSGWKVVAGCFFLMFFGSGIVSSTAPLFMAPICQQFGFDPAAYSVINLIGSLTNAIAAMVIAPKLQKGNMKAILIGSTVIAGITYAGLGFCSQLWQFFLLSAIVNAAVAGLSGLTASMLLTSWFIDKRSLAIGISFTGYGVGSAIWAKVFGSIMANGSWTTCYFLGGVALLIACTLAVLFLLKQSPESCGEQPYVSSENHGDSASASSVEVWQGLTASQALKTFSFWMLAIAMFFIGTLSAGVATHAINYLISIGWEMTAASSILALFNLVSIVSMLAGGVMFDKLGLLRSTFVVVAAAVLALLSLFFAQTPAFAYLYAILFPFAMMMPKMLPTLLTSACFGVKAYGSIYSYLNLVFLIGCALGAVITGVIYNMAGYGAAWILFIVFSLLILVCTCLAISRSKVLKERYPNPPSEQTT